MVVTRRRGGPGRATGGRSAGIHRFGGGEGGPRPRDRRPQAVVPREAPSRRRTVVRLRGANRERVGGVRPPARVPEAPPLGGHGGRGGSSGHRECLRSIHAGFAVVLMVVETCEPLTRLFLSSSGRSGSRVYRTVTMLSGPQGRSVNLRLRRCTAAGVDHRDLDPILVADCTGQPAVT